jgi:transposase, IS5 family
MDSFNKTLIRQEYQKLAAAERQIDWERFRPILTDLYTNDTEKEGGRPNHDPILMVKLLVLQSWYGLGDEETERQTLGQAQLEKVLRVPG